MRVLRLTGILFFDGICARSGQRNSHLLTGKELEIVRIVCSITCRINKLTCTVQNTELILCISIRIVTCYRFFNSNRILREVVLNVCSSIRIVGDGDHLSIHIYHRLGNTRSTRCSFFRDGILSGRNVHRFKTVIPARFYINECLSINEAIRSHSVHCRFGIILSFRIHDRETIGLVHKRIAFLWSQSECFHLFIQDQLMCTYSCVLVGKGNGLISILLHLDRSGSFYTCKQILRAGSIVSTQFGYIVITDRNIIQRIRSICERTPADFYRRKALRSGDSKLQIGKIQVA